MPYEYLEDITTADAAFRAWGSTLDEMFVAAADATMGVMVEELESIAKQERRTISLQDDNVEMLLFGFLQELIYYKDAEQLLLRMGPVEVAEGATGLGLRAQGWGEQINPGKHELIVDVKAVTMHRFGVRQTARGWEATVVVDV